MARIPVEVLIKAKDNASAVLKKLSNNISKNSKSLGDRLDDAAAASLGFGAAIAGAGAFAVNAASNFEQNAVALETMLGSAEDADRLLRDMTQFAKTTPFELRNLQDTTLKLLAYGSEQETVLDELRMLGDIASGVGMDKLPALTLAYGQVQAATKLTGQEMRQFTEAGVPLIDGLAKHFGIATSEVQDLVSASKVGFEDVKVVLEDLTGVNGKFQDLMQKQSKTTAGQISNLKDEVYLLAAEVGESLLPIVNEFVEFLRNSVIPKVRDLASWLRENEGAIAPLVGAILGGLVPALWLMVSPFIALLPFVAAGGALAMLFQWLDKLSRRVTGYGLLDQLLALIELIQPKVDALARAVQDLWGKLNSVSNSRFNVLGQLEAGLQLLQKRQLGGETSVGKPYVVGERGPEVFVPNQSGRIIPNNKSGGSGGNISFNVNVGMYAGSANERRNIAEILYNDLARLASGHGKTVQEMFG